MADALTARYSPTQAVADQPADVQIIQEAFNSSDLRTINKALSWAKAQRSKLFEQSAEPNDAPSITNPRESHAKSLTALNGVISALYQRLAAAASSNGVVPYDPNGLVGKFFRPNGTFAVNSTAELNELAKRGELDNFIRATQLVANYARESTYLDSWAARSAIEELKLPVPERSYGSLINIVARASVRLEEAKQKGNVPSPSQLDRAIWAQAKQAKDYDPYYDETIKYLSDNKALIVVDIVQRKKAGKISIADYQAEMSELKKQPPTSQTIKRIAELTRLIRENK